MKILVFGFIQFLPYQKKNKLDIQIFGISMKSGKINNRILFLSPTVQAGWQAESFRTDFQNLKSLGKGAFGVVWKGKHKKTGKIYAIKQIKKKSINTAKLLQHVKTQVRIMYLLNHPNIIKLYNHFQDEISIYFVLQFAEQGQLYKYMLNKQNNKLSQQTSSIYIDQVVEALEFIHRHNVIHRDIKPENILIDKDGNVKLADFGWSNFVDEPYSKRETYCGTLDYLAPEMIEASHSHDYRVDIWSVGVLIYELVCGFSPFSYELLKANNMSEKLVKQNISKLNFSLPEIMSPECQDLVKKLLVLQPQKRLSIAQIKKHPWIQKYRPKTLKPQNQYQQQWYSNLKNQFSTLNSNTNDQQQQGKKNDIFTEEQIYHCSRIDGILNKKITQGLERENQKDRRIKQLQLRVKQLELQNKIKDQDMKESMYEKNKQINNSTKPFDNISRDSHQECHKKVQMLMQKIKQQDEQMRAMHAKIMQNQRKLREKNT